MLLHHEWDEQRILYSFSFEVMFEEFSDLMSGERMINFTLLMFIFVLFGFLNVYSSLCRYKGYIEGA